MTVAQIYELMNDVTEEILGESNLISEDLSNVVDVGGQILNTNVDNYCKVLVDRIGKTIFVNRPYSGSVPRVIRDSFSFGSVLQKISYANLPEVEENESWSLTDRATYDQQTFYKPDITVKYFNKKVTFECPISFTEKQVRESFLSAQALGGFIAMIETAITNTMTVKIDALVMETINAMTAETMYTEYNSGSTFTGASHVKAINLLYEYNTKFSKSLTASGCLFDKDFVRYAVYRIAQTEKRLGKMSTLFNLDAKPRFTPADKLVCVLAADFTAAADAYLASDTFHNDFVALPQHDSVPYWQGSGDDYDEALDIKVKTPDNHTVTASGILGVMFDEDCVAICNEDRRITTAYNAKGEFWNQWSKYDCQSIAAKDENFVVFFVAAA